MLTSGNLMNAAPAFACTGPGHSYQITVSLSCPSQNVRQHHSHQQALFRADLYLDARELTILHPLHCRLGVQQHMLYLTEKVLEVVEHPVMQVRVQSHETYSCEPSDAGSCKYYRSVHAVQICMKYASLLEFAMPYGPRAFERGKSICATGVPCYENHAPANPPRGGTIYLLHHRLLCYDLPHAFGFRTFEQEQSCLYTRKIATTWVQSLQP